MNFGRYPCQATAMKNNPQPAELPKTLRANAVQKIMESDDRDPKSRDEGRGKKNQSPQRDHGPADPPEDSGADLPGDLPSDFMPVVEGKVPSQPHQRQFEHHQPKAARQQKPG